MDLDGTQNHNHDELDKEPELIQSDPDNLMEQDEQEHMEAQAVLQACALELNVPNEGAQSVNGDEDPENPAACHSSWIM
jgi:hypothetical protein